MNAEPIRWFLWSNIRQEPDERAAEQIARRSERIHFSALDLKDEAAQTVQ